MRKMILMALIAATAMPVAANAQSRGEIRRDYRELREEQRELDRAYRRGDPRDIRDERRDVREARREYRENFNDRGYRWGRDDWRGYRNYNRDFYRGGGWRAPFRYNSFRVGVRISPQFYGSRYFINDPWRYRLPSPGRYQRWVRHYNDVILVDVRRGIVIDVIRGFYW